MGAKISKRYSSYKLQPKVLKLFLNFPPYGPHKSMFGIFEISSLRFVTNFFRKLQIYHCSLWRNQKPQLSKNTSDRRTKRSEIWDSWVLIQHIRGTFGLLAFKVILGSFGVFQIFKNLVSQKRQFLE